LGSWTTKINQHNNATFNHQKLQLFDDETQPITQVKHNHNTKVIQYAMWILLTHSMLQIRFLDYKHIILQQECLVIVSCERNAQVSENS
jgi:hypothetical protein